LKKDGEGRGVLGLVSSPAYLELLVQLAAAPSYPRELARLLGRSESEVSRRLRVLERHGLVEAVWARVSGRTVRLYRARIRRVSLDLATGTVTLERDDGVTRARIPLPACGSPPPPPDPFVGREREARLLERADGPVYLWGPPGIGKTSLLSKTLGGNTVWNSLAEWPGLGLIARRLACHALLQGRQDLAGLVREGAVDPAGLAEAVAHAYRGYGGWIVVDEYERAGIAVRRFVRRLAGAGVRLAVASRAPPPSWWPGATVRLGPLSRGETWRLVEALGGDPEGAWEASRGHPVLAILYARGAYRGGAAGYILGEYLDGIPPEDREVFHALACIPDPVGEGLLTRLLGRRVHASLTRLVAAGLAKREAGGYTVHEHARQALSGTPEAARLLGEAARLLSRGGWRDRVRALDYALRCGSTGLAAGLVARRILEGSHDYLYYLDYYGPLALQTRPGWEPRLAACILAEHANIHRQNGRLDKALQASTMAVQVARTGGGDPGCAARAYCMHGFILAATGDTRAAIRSLEECRRTAESAGDGIGVLEAVMNMAMAHAIAGEFDRMVAMVEEEKRLATRLGDPFTSIMASIHLAAAYILEPEPAKAEREARDAASAAEALSYPLAKAQANAILSLALWLQDRDPLPPALAAWSEGNLLPPLHRDIVASYSIVPIAASGMPRLALDYCRAAPLASNDAALACMVAGLVGGEEAEAARAAGKLSRPLTPYDRRMLQVITSRLPMDVAARAASLAG